jgi:OTU domain-containing protein 5
MRKQPVKLTSKEEHDLIVSQLANRGMKMCKIADDGNCLFRAIADQVFDDSERHAEVRKRCVQHMRENPADFENFLDEHEKPYDKYCERMAKNAAWGGNIELMAALAVYKANVRIMTVLAVYKADDKT